MHPQSRKQVSEHIETLEMVERKVREIARRDDTGTDERKALGNAVDGLGRVRAELIEAVAGPHPTDMAQEDDPWGQLD